MASRLKLSKQRLGLIELKQRLIVKPRQTTAQIRLRGSAWVKRRAAVLLRDAYTCRCCGCLVSPSQAECDHIIPLVNGGSDEESNLQTLCIECHAKKSAAENKQRYR